jgi:DNA-binding transcriptional LysR family regulator
LGNISHAAEQLYISQPAISKAISKLEESLEIKLFIRNHRGVKLTSEGQILFEHLKTAFDAISIGEKRLKQINELGIGQIKIGASITLSKYMLLPYLKEFVENNPHIKVIIDCQSSTQATKLLDDNIIDFALIVKPDTYHNFDFFPIAEIEYIFVATEKYLENLHLREGRTDMSDKEFEITLFKSANLMLLDEENITRKYVDAYFKENGIEITQVLQVNNMDLLIDFAKIGLGVSCVIKEFVIDDLNAGRIKEIILPNSISKKKVGFAYSHTMPPTSCMEKFIKFYKSY